MPARFEDREDAGRRLAAALSEVIGDEETVVLGLARGGVPVAAEVAHRLGAELDVYLVRKLGVPGHEELAMGAIASGGVRVLNEDVVGALDASPVQVDEVAAREQRELERREQAYRGDRPPLRVAGKVAVLVDDGLATGASMRAAVAAVRRLGPTRLVVAVPTAPPEVCREFERNEDVDQVVCLDTPSPFMGVGAWYRDFRQTSDQQVRELLKAPGG
jgi:predicted phosphoribosyltransferase